MKILGLKWYWWVLIIALVLLGIWWSKKKKKLAIAEAVLNVLDTPSAGLTDSQKMQLALKVADKLNEQQATSVLESFSLASNSEIGNWTLQQKIDRIKGIIYLAYT